jgi:hypothetical protein
MTVTSIRQYVLPPSLATWQVYSGPVLLSGVALALSRETLQLTLLLHAWIQL